MKQLLNRALPVALGVALFGLAGCKQTPNQVILSPQVQSPIGHVYANQAIKLTTQDMRKGNHIVQILKEGEAATLYSPNLAVDQVLGQSVTQYFKDQGLLISSQAGITMRISVDTALVSVHQELMKYQAVSEIALRVEIARNEQTLTTKFNSKGTSEGPLNADLAVLERDLNQQLGKLVVEIANHEDIKAFIR